jgi:glycosyltransferase involved in cell wall biosynthesis
VINQPEVSILLPYRNAASTLPECFDSILAQTFTDYEIVAVDDASDDDSTVVLNNYSDSRLRLISNDRPGLVNALNLGLAHCNAPLVARMDADDIMLPQRLQQQWQYMRSHHDVVLLATQAEKFPPELIREGYREYMRWQNAVISHDDIAAQIYIESPFAHPSVMFRRDSIIAAGAYRDGPFPEDYELWLRLYHQGFRMEKLPQVLLRWRESEKRLSRVSDSYSREAFDRLRAEYLSRDQRLKGRVIVYWGAGRITRRRVKHLQDRGFAPHAWIDIDPKKIGNVIDGARVHEPAWLEAESVQNKPFVLNYVTNHGARDITRNYLQRIGYLLGEDFLEVG